MSARPARYTRLAIWLHWIVAVLMLFMLFPADNYIRVPVGASLAGWRPSAHASIGILILLLGLARLLWRMGHPPPVLPPAMPRWEVLAARLSHWSLYALMIGLPVLGLLALVPYGAERLDLDRVRFLGLIRVAVLPNLGEWTVAGHGLLANLAQVLIVVHVAAALKHQFWDRDGLLGRMRPG